MVLEKAARGSDSVSGRRSEPSQHPKDPQMKGEKHSWGHRKETQQQ